MKEFLDYSKNNRKNFLDILSNEKEKNMSFMTPNLSIIYLKNIYEEYQKYLNKLFDDYIKENNIVGITIENCICDFLTSMKPQIDDTTFITKDEITCHVCCIEYNMIVNIHKFSYELYILNHNLDEKMFFHGTSLGEALENIKDSEERKKIISSFRDESYYDIDCFNYIDFKNDIDYLRDSTMEDIYLLSIISDALKVSEYDDQFAIGYMMNARHMLDKSTYRYMLTLEDAIKYKKSALKPLLNTFFVVIILLLVAIYITVKFVK